MSILRYVIIGFLIWGAVNCVHKEVEPSVDMSQWQGRMQSMAGSLSRLMPLLYSQREFDNPKNKDIIKEEVKSLVSYAHKVEKTDKPSADPALDFVSKHFAYNMDQAVRQMDGGNSEYARALIRNSTSYCIACHTRTDEGRGNLKLSAFADTSRLSKAELLDFSLAVRDYDKALEVGNNLINSADAQIESPRDIELAAKKMLAVTIRVERDREASLKLVDRIVNARWAPVYLRLEALNWKKAIIDWGKENKKVEGLSPSKQLEFAEGLLRQSWKTLDTYPQTQVGLVQALRASTILHDLLQKRAPSHYAETLYYSGLASQALRDLNLGSLHEAYYETCIRQSPYTDYARRCYLRLEASLFSQYSAYDGVYMPQEVRFRLNELRLLTEKKDEDFFNWGMQGE